MTAVGGPGAVLLDGGKRMLRGGWWFALMGGVVAAAVGRVSLLGTQVLSRDRELAADAGSAALTGRPAALASALRRISGQLALIPQEDLRVAACRDIFHLLAVEEEGNGWAGRFGATHPPLEQRIERLERMERAMASARLPRAARSGSTAGDGPTPRRPRPSGWAADRSGARRCTSRAPATARSAGGRRWRRRCGPRSRSAGRE